ncbi:hypothetical protein A1O3_02922 [Capronia epimyces CBS 606.96]|uniref:F-box domain-containing protein n=1 Tax=Capronia epimyces CBS 606.96 TaxID=1182542 RepID=W9YJL7_9EURO|nr:uncharacterized protein A1O3_02922 [Capronia epimyces CBS 606.96]EXJ89855.1 hypothetical protein A1O3_02922 [Capronia epimyces CBS 606.96]
MASNLLTDLKDTEQKTEAPMASNLVADLKDIEQEIEATMASNLLTDLKDTEQQTEAPMASNLLVDLKDTEEKVEATMTSHPYALDEFKDRASISFHIPLKIMGTIAMEGGRPAITEKTSAFENLPLEVHTGIIRVLKHVDAAILALTSKTMAAIVLGDPDFSNIADWEEMGHLKLHHGPFFEMLYGTDLLRPLIPCHIIPCPLYARQMWIWSARVKTRAWIARQAERQIAKASQGKASE